MQSVLMDCLEQAKKWELLHSPHIGHLNPDDYLQLCLDAGYEEEAAQKMATSWAEERQKKDVPLWG